MRQSRPIDKGHPKRRGNAKKHLTQQPHVKNHTSLIVTLIVLPGHEPGIQHGR